MSLSRWSPQTASFPVRTHRSRYDAVVVGTGPGGLAAAVLLARHGLSVAVFEGQDTVGGGMRSAELTLPGFVHDVCSAIHPMGVASPWFRQLPLERFGLEWITPPAALAHPLEGRAVLLEGSVEHTARTLGADAARYRTLMGPLSERWQSLVPELLQPLLHLPRDLPGLVRFGLPALLPARALAGAFRTPEARALLAGLAGHTVMPLEAPATGAITLMLGLIGHAVGWPLPRGGSQAIADALAGYLRFLGGEIYTGAPVADLTELPPARAVLLDLVPRGALKVLGHRLPSAYARQLEAYRHGAGVFKVDYALSAPVPWASPEVARAGTVHLGGSLEEIARSEREVGLGRAPERPYVLVAQQSLFDDTRAPDGKHTLWAYCHVPGGFAGDLTERIEAQIERFAPGFRDTVLARRATTAPAFEAYNPNYVGGDVNGGSSDLWQLLARPTLSAVPYRTPLPGVYLCSAATPPGGGVHGMGGYHAARHALRDVFGMRPRNWPLR
ncbi:phytoene dehydrogenase-like protein [Deinobacterium chartae]|uniref:Phytoene dehydrogenase-like protein n=1 Tax=Deinobacterium chartae TaxID=521158 RepID=A0A841I3Z0_9DEIO|nr:NAD(P)/FAD-dependent oxidoreductase [Deinobacterium chartae]MBB6098625.1 phytoene dehydrogenase-like protein [Deinobacterium chartae]